MNGALKFDPIHRRSCTRMKVVWVLYWVSESLDGVTHKDWHRTVSLYPMDYQQLNTVWNTGPQLYVQDPLEVVINKLLSYISLYLRQSNWIDFITLTYVMIIYSHTECVAEQSSRLQSPINLHAQLHPLCSAALVPNILPRRDEGSGMPCAVMKPYSILALT